MRERIELAETYADAVIGVLADDFPDLRDPTVASLVRSQIATHAYKPGRLEVIVDDPISARWRLVGNRHKPGRVVLDYWSMTRTQATQDQLARLNAALDALDMEEQR